MWSPVVSLVIVIVIIDGRLCHKELEGQSNTGSTTGTGGLSIGGKIGVGVVGGAFILAVTIVLGLCCMKKRGYEPLPGSSSSLQVGGICCSCACVGVCRKCRSTVELPQIIQQPANQLDVVPGTEVWFTVTATGAEDLAYKWQRDGANLLEEGGVSGTTTNTLTITSVHKRDSGTYKCVVSNAAGETSSDPAELTLRHVCNCPEIKCISNHCKCHKDGLPCVPQCHCKGEPGDCFNPKNIGQ